MYTDWITLDLGKNFLVKVFVTHEVTATDAEIRELAMRALLTKVQEWRYVPVSAHEAEAGDDGVGKARR